MKKLLLAALAVAGLATACRKDNDDVVCPEPGPASLDGLRKRHAPPVQVFEFNSTIANTFRTAAGAQLVIQPNIFVRLDGTAPTGALKLLFQEIYTPADMVLADMPTVTLYGQPLESGGEFQIRVLEGTNRLKLAPFAIRNSLVLNSPVPARTSADVVRQMQLWARTTGGLSRPDSAGWFLAQTPRDSLGFTQPIPVQLDFQGGGGNSPSFLTTTWPDTLGWLNCDAYPPVPTRVTVGIDVDSLPGELRAYLIPHDRNGAFRPRWTSWLNQFYYNELPPGLDLTAVVLRVRDGKYYFGTHRAPVADNFVYRPVLEEVSEEELVRRIRLL